MKRILACTLFIMLAISGLSAPAEGAAPLSGSSLPEGVTAAADLDGDGASEKVSWAMVPEDEYESKLTLTVQPSDGDAVSYKSWIMSFGSVYILDLDGDGRLEVLLTGDAMSDDYITLCLHYADGALYEVLFPDSNRGDNSDGYYKYGYGLITGITGNLVTLEGSQDMLGTWMASRMVTLTPYERFEFCDNGLWEMKVSDPAEIDELWQYRALTVSQPIAYRGAGGSPSGTLQKGERILIYATDKQERAWFTTKDGARGVLTISADYDRGWGWLVDGKPEAECFEYVPYAD